MAGVGFVAIAAAIAALLNGGAHRPSDATRGPVPQTLPITPPANPPQLAADLNSAQRIIDSPASSAAELASAGGFEQLATVELDHAPASFRATTIASLGAAARATIDANIAAARALSTLASPHPKLPSWRIIQPPAATVLLGYFEAAQQRYAVPWQYLAAIELIETRFGRVDGVSSAGAQGPMQFLPGTWAAYGRGNVHDPRDAILGAAHYLVASGAPRDMSGALYHYNPSSAYVTAVQAYARRMQSDPRAYYGYYNWQVIYAYARGPVILPVGYPRARPVPLRLP